MCEATVFMSKGEELEKVMEDVVELKREGEKLLLVDVFGEQRIISAKVGEVRLMDHRIVLHEG